jgi:CheY-like chemotaxis protein/Tfp pilus assembly protein PilZ
VIEVKSKPERKTLLLVDDVELFLQLQISYLENPRFQIHAARSGKEALEKARSLHPDLVLLDMFMPDIQGDEVCRTLKENPGTASIPVILVSSGSRDESKKRAEAAGCDGLIYKPVRRDLLLSVVEKCLGISMRRNARVRVLLPAVIVTEGEEIPATIHTLSTDGAFVEIEKKIIVGSLMELRFKFLHEDQTIIVRTAAVVWCGALEDNGPKGVGVRFLSIYPESKEHINRFLKFTLKRDIDEEDLDNTPDT